MWQGDDKECLIASAQGVTRRDCCFDPVSGQRKNKANRETYELCHVQPHCKHTDPQYMRPFKSLSIQHLKCYHFQAVSILNNYLNDQLNLLRHDSCTNLFESTAGLCFLTKN